MKQVFSGIIKKSTCISNYCISSYLLLILPFVVENIYWLKVRNDAFVTMTMACFIPCIVLEFLTCIADAFKVEYAKLTAIGKYERSKSLLCFSIVIILLIAGALSIAVRFGAGNLAKILPYIDLEENVKKCIKIESLLFMPVALFLILERLCFFKGKRVMRGINVFRNIITIVGYTVYAKFGRGDSFLYSSSKVKIGCYILTIGLALIVLKYLDKKDESYQGKTNWSVSGVMELFTQIILQVKNRMIPVLGYFVLFLVLSKVEKINEDNGYVLCVFVRYFQLILLVPMIVKMTICIAVAQKKVNASLIVIKLSIVGAAVTTAVVGTTIGKVVILSKEVNRNSKCLLVYAIIFTVLCSIKTIIEGEKKGKNIRINPLVQYGPWIRAIIVAILTPIINSIPSLLDTISMILLHVMLGMIACVITFVEINLMKKSLVRSI